MTSQPDINKKGGYHAAGPLSRDSFCFLGFVLSVNSSAWCADKAAPAPAPEAAAAPAPEAAAAAAPAPAPEPAAPAAPEPEPAPPVAAPVPTDIAADQLEDWKEAFGLFDRVGDSKIAFNQVADIMRALGQNPTNKDVAAILGNPTADDMANNRLDFNSFLPMLSGLVASPQKGTYDDYVEGLRVFDKEGNGTVMGAELRIVLSTLGEKLNESEIDALMTGQEDENGSINYESFVKHILSV
ncbi:myosin light chain 3, skeletal muscle isoform-like [Conger conger]|uniref:myosin light chain 3, skeletal muscle isoform-like n=1 Tax=Conger conger TaxID=82655 RepID=UPI002A599ADB|nr:myosin light chain 3, skeletal muscle isoform-like [Conger conger]